MKTLLIKKLLERIAICAIVVLSFSVSFAQVSNVPKMIGLNPPIDTLPDPVPNPDPLPPHYFPNIPPHYLPNVPPNVSGDVTPRMSGGNNAPTISEPDVEIFPNPNNGQFTLAIHSPTSERVKVMITDITGKQIFAQDLGNFNSDYTNVFDLSDRGKGLYILSIEQNNKQITKRIVIN